MDREEWFRRNTYHHRDFADIGRLAARKEELGLKVSVCLPTLNVATTLRTILRVMRTELMERHALIDQLAIIDSRSKDGTLDIARQEGAEIFFDDEILPGLEPASGKGEALWKSLFALTGDIIVWIDSDIENIHPRFAYGLIGPLLERPEVGFVKGFYERPLKEGEVLRPSGGGRVTELVARPIINLFYPELTGLLQPLSGEYAGRRSVLESIPFMTGYGVEIAMVLDIYSTFGLESIAQVDLEVRQHHNQGLPALSRMSFGVMQAAFRRLAEEGKLALMDELETVYNAVKREGAEYALEPVDIELVERPPMGSISEYIDRGS